MRTKFEELLQKYEKEIYRFAWRLTGNREDAADILQETFLRAFRAHHRLPSDTNHRAWLYRVAGRLCINLARSKKARRSVSIDEARHLAERRSVLESLVETRRLERRLAEIIDKLSSRQRMALLQRKYEGLSYREVASILGCSQQAARAHVYQAMGKIRRGLASSPRRAPRRAPRKR